MAQGNTFADHIRELRSRFFVVAAVFLLSSAVAYVFRDHLMTALLGPLDGQKLLYLTPAGGFTFIFLVSIYAGLAVTIPVLIYQIYCFARPALPLRSQRFGGKLLLLSLLLLIGGVLFGYVYAVPGALRFLGTFAGDYVESALTADSYLNFIVGYTVGLGVIFQLPLLLFVFHKIKPLSPGGLLKSERWVILFAFIAAALITPTPDPLNQTIIALPVIVIYQLGVIAVLVSIRNDSRAKRRTRNEKRLATASPSAPVAPIGEPVKPVQAIPTLALRQEHTHQTSKETRPLPRTVERSIERSTPRPRTVDGFSVMQRMPSQYSSRS